MQKKIGSIVRFHRKMAGISQKELADLAGIGKTAVFNLEVGKNNFRIETLLKILEILNIKLDFTSQLMNLWSGEYEKNFTENT